MIPHWSSELTRNGGLLLQIKCKVHYGSQTRALAIEPAISLMDLAERIGSKFGLGANDVMLKYKDSEGCQMAIGDEEDWGICYEEGIEGRKGVELWVERK